MTAAERAHQLALDLPHAEGFGPRDFLPAQSNRVAYDAVMAWPSWPAPALLLEGPEGAGKTHLARIWARRARAVAFTAAELWEPAAPLQRLGSARAAVVDPAEIVQDERQLFHLYNRLTERDGSLLLTTRLPLPDWPLALPDLRSRLATAWRVRIDPPCDALLAALLVKQFADRQLRVDADVVDYLLARMERSFGAVRQIVEALDRASLRARRPIRLGLARLVLQALTEDREADATMGALAQPNAPERPQEWRLDEWISG
jgi:chromosomal replication initiation ATPase DnaA